MEFFPMRRCRFAANVPALIGARAIARAAEADVFRRVHRVLVPSPSNTASRIRRVRERGVFPARAT